MRTAMKPFMASYCWKCDRSLVSMIFKEVGGLSKNLWRSFIQQNLRAVLRNKRALQLRHERAKSTVVLKPCFNTLTSEVHTFRGP
jgi:hypothetical protein